MNATELRAAAGEYLALKYKEIKADRRDGERLWYGEHVEAAFVAGAAFCPADDDEPVDPDWLHAVGAKGGNDDPVVDVYDIAINGDLVVRITLRFNRGEIESSSIGLSWTYKPYAICDGTVSLAYGIDDEPTRGTVRRLCEALGAPLKEGAN